MKSLKNIKEKDFSLKWDRISYLNIPERVLFCFAFLQVRATLPRSITSHPPVVQLSARSGSISSLDYPSFYPHNFHQTVKISANNNSRILIKFQVSKFQHQLSNEIMHAQHNNLVKGVVVCWINLVNETQSRKKFFTFF